MIFLPFRSILCILIIISFQVYAQEGQDSVLQTQKRLPILNGFRFMPSDVIRDPFINTFVKINLGSGTALDLNTYRKNLQGNVVDTLSGDLTYVGGELEFQYAFNDWLGIYANYGGSGRLGSNAYTLLTSGVSYVIGFAIGGKIRIWQNDEMLLTGIIDYSSKDVYLYSIYDFVKEVYETGVLDSTSTLLQVETLPQTFLGVNYAYALTDYFGFYTSFEWGIGKAFDAEKKGNVTAGLAASVDLLNVDFIEFPIGLLGSIRYNTFSESGEDVNDLLTYGLRIAYTGHKDFDIGVETTYSSLQYLKFDQKVKTVLAEFKMLYYF